MLIQIADTIFGSSGVFGNVLVVMASNTWDFNHRGLYGGWLLLYSPFILVFTIFVVIIYTVATSENLDEVEPIFISIIRTFCP